MIDSSRRNQVALAVLQGMYSNGPLCESFARTASATIEKTEKNVEWQDDRIAAEVRSEMVTHSFLIADEFLKQAQNVPKKEKSHNSEIPNLSL